MCMSCQARWARPGPGRQPSAAAASGSLATASSRSLVFLRTNSNRSTMSVLVMMLLPVYGDAQGEGTSITLSAGARRVEAAARAGQERFLQGERSEGGTSTTPNYDSCYMLRGRGDGHPVTRM